MPAARAADPRVKQVIASLSTEEVVVLLATASGWTVGDVRPLTRLNVTVIAEDGGKREIGSWGGGGRVPFDFFLEEERWTPLRGEAARQAILKLASGRGAGRHDDGRARAGLAGDPAPRGDRARPRGRLQPQGRLGLRRAPGPEGRLGAGDRGRRRHDPESARLAQRGRRGHADRPHRADRERRPHRLHAGPAQRAAHGDDADRQRPARVLRASRRCRA